MVGGPEDPAAHITALHLGNQWSGFDEAFLPVIKHFDR